jgi:DNA polymerase IV
MIGFLRIPYFAATLESQRDPALAGAPLILVEYGKKRGKVTAISPEAQASGVSVGLSLNRARALCPNGHYLTRSAQAVPDALLMLLWTFTNRVELDPVAFPQTAVCYLDLGTLYEADLHHIGSQLAETIKQQLGLDSTVGIATGKFPALLAATIDNPVTLIPPGQEAAFVAPFPVELLPLSKDAARRLDMLYIRTLGELAVISREAMVAQFGRPGRLLYYLAQGMDGRPVNPRQMPASEGAARSFDDPIEDQNRLDVHLHQMAGDLANRLEARHHALHAVALCVGFESGRTVIESLHLLQPAASAARIAHTLQQLLARMPMTEGITSLHIDVTHLVPNIPRQLELFTRKPEQQPLIDLIERLASRHSSTPLYKPVLERPDSLLPERRFSFRGVS